MRLTNGRHKFILPHAEFGRNDHREDTPIFRSQQPFLAIGDLKSLTLLNCFNNQIDELPANFHVVRNIIGLLDELSRVITIFLATTIATSKLGYESPERTSKTIQ